jgi:hypothetical protein
VPASRLATRRRPISPATKTITIKGVTRGKWNHFKQQARLRGMTHGEYQNWLIDHAEQVESRLEKRA